MTITVIRNAVRFRSLPLGDSGKRGVLSSEESRADACASDTCLSDARVSDSPRNNPTPKGEAGEVPRLAQALEGSGVQFQAGDDILELGRKLQVLRATPCHDPRKTVPPLRSRLARRLTVIARSDPASMPDSPAIRCQHLPEIEST